jgi:hypothetical protein
MLDGAKSRATAVEHELRRTQREALRLAPTGRPSLLLVAKRERKRPRRQEGDGRSGSLPDPRLRGSGRDPVDRVRG